MLRVFIVLFAAMLMQTTSAQDVENYVLEDVNGSQSQLWDSFLEGKMVLIYHYFNACNDCAYVTSVLRDYYEQAGKEEGCFEVLAVNISGDDAVSIQNFATDNALFFSFYTQSENSWISNFHGESFGVGLFEAPGVQLYDPTGIRLFRGNGPTVLSDGTVLNLILDNAALDCADLSEVVDEVETGIADSHLTDIVLFPNPSGRGDLLRLVIPNIERVEPTALRIVDKKGSVVFERSVEVSEDAIVLPSLGTGLFFLELRRGSKSSIQKIIRR